MLPNSGAMLPNSGLRHRPAAMAAEPCVLVVGATGKVGTLVVRDLLQAGVRPRCAVRDPASSAAGALAAMSPKVELVSLDLAKDAEDRFVAACAGGVDACIAVSGTSRFSKLVDFLPWRIFGQIPSADAAHPFAVNYVGISALAAAANSAGVKRFVRLTGLSVGFPASNPVALLFNLLLSLTSKWHARAEQAIRREGFESYTILRPGGLRDDARPAGVGLLVSRESALPPPGRIARADVAALAVLSAIRPEGAADSTLSISWGAAGDGAPATWEAALAALPPRTAADRMDASGQPFGAATAALAYALLCLVGRLGLAVWALGARLAK